jgi:hypothetical protein
MLSGCTAQEKKRIGDGASWQGTGEVIYRCGTAYVLSGKNFPFLGKDFPSFPETSRERAVTSNSSALPKRFPCRCETLRSYDHRPLRS